MRSLMSQHSEKRIALQQLRGITRLRCTPIQRLFPHSKLVYANCDAGVDLPNQPDNRLQAMLMNQVMKDAQPEDEIISANLQPPDDVLDPGTFEGGGHEALLFRQRPADRYIAIKKIRTMDDGPPRRQVEGEIALRASKIEHPNRTPQCHPQVVDHIEDDLQAVLATTGATVGNFWMAKNGLILFG
ncbi:hypothetical protein MOU_13218 [Xanthomonas citri pv. malvacearum str. GSPB1386]|nr:hypothetical protein MOU_13218 [Xanthomonas citri pv. malvacearum str. GSPB1386]